MQRLFSVVFTAVVLLAAGVAADGQGAVLLAQKAEPLVGPEVVIPLEAVSTGLGGNVDVLVRVDNAGRVVGILGISGPGFICHNVTRSDVLAIRAEAERVALGTIFTPTLANGEAIEFTTTLKINFDNPNKGNEADGTTSGNKDAYTGERFTVLETSRDSGAGSPGKNTALNDKGKINGGVLNSKAIRLVTPPYPPAARAIRASGAVSVQILVTEDGSVFTAEAVSGHPLLRAAARGAACESLFEPALLSGQPVKYNGIITYNFIP